MKTSFFIAFIGAMICLHASATEIQRKSGEPVSYSSSMKRVVVGNGVHVVLINGTTKNASQTPSSLSTDIQIVEKSGILHVKRKRLSADSCTIYIQVQELQYLEISEGGSVSSSNILASSGLHVVLHPNAHVDLRVTGSIRYQLVEEAEMGYLQQSGNVISVY